MANLFRRANILIPTVSDLTRWSVIACDQFTSDDRYWQRVRQFVGASPSTLHMIIPEAELDAVDDGKIAGVHATMHEYLQRHYFREYENAYVYVERTLNNGLIRSGVLGVVDLKQYDYAKNAETPIRATEETVCERLPPRVRIRWDAELEFPHVLMLCDDECHTLIERLQLERDALPLLYDINLMEGGGRIRGWIMQGAVADAFDARFDDYCRRCRQAQPDLPADKAILAVGDGNHSLAAAKQCWRMRSCATSADDPSGFALAELVNLHDNALEFEPIHRVLTGVDTDQLLHDLSAICGDSGHLVTIVIGDTQLQRFLRSNGDEPATAILQPFLDHWLAAHPGSLDYIHGEEEVRRLAAGERAVGFLLPAIEKKNLFRMITKCGALPRKTFSMGHAREKRYYLEGRKIK